MHFWVIPPEMRPFAPPALLDRNDGKESIAHAAIERSLGIPPDARVNCQGAKIECTLSVRGLFGRAQDFLLLRQCGRKPIDAHG